MIPTCFGRLLLELFRAQACCHQSEQQTYSTLPKLSAATPSSSVVFRNQTVDCASAAIAPQCDVAQTSGPAGCLFTESSLAYRFRFCTRECKQAVCVVVRVFVCACGQAGVHALLPLPLLLSVQRLARNSQSTNRSVLLP